MLSPFFKGIPLTFLCTAIVYGQRPVGTYSDLQAEGVTCEPRDTCENYSSNVDFTERSCECDPLCTAYGDCCIDAPARRHARRRPQPRYSNMDCLHVGEEGHSGVYVISRCSSEWIRSNRSTVVRQKCEGYVGFSDPLRSAPVTDVAQSLTYRNVFCAECNYARTASLKSFRLKIIYDGLQELSEAQILGDLTYNRRLDAWGIYRLNRRGDDSEFIICDIIYEVPDYLIPKVRFCRSNIISQCAPRWNRERIETLCSEYMAVVYQGDNAFRNPHCAICNNIAVDSIFCVSSLHGKKKPMSFALLLDVNQSDGEEVGMRRMATPACPSGQKYDPFFKKCRQLVCALPGHIVVNGKCVRG